MDLKDHLRAVGSFSLDKCTEDELEKVAKDVQRYIRQAKRGRTATLRKDIMDTVVIFAVLEKEKRLGGAEVYPALRAYDGTKAFLALRAYVVFILEECPNMKAELTELLAPRFDLRITLQ
jgi:hypothetical protein